MFRSTLLTVFCVAACFLAVASAASPNSPLRRLQRDPFKPLVADRLTRLRGAVAHIHQLVQRQYSAINNHPATDFQFNLQASNKTCRDAMKGLNDATKSSNCNLKDVIAGFVNPIDTVNTSVSDFCTAECPALLERELSYVVGNCTGAEDFETLPDFRDALLAAKATCLQDADGTYCPIIYQRLSALTGAFLNNSLDPSGDSLEQAGCFSSCVTNEFSTVTEYATGPVAGTLGFYKLLCSQIELDDCAISYQEYVADRVPADQTSQLNAVCSPCFRRFVNGLYQMTSLGPVLDESGQVSTDPSAITPESLVGTLNSLSYMCALDGNGQYCVQREASVAANFSGCGASFSNVSAPIQGTCSAECVNSVTTVINEAGCCANTVFELLNTGTIQQGDTPAIQYIHNFLTSTCNLTVPNSCAVDILNVTLAIQNINPDWAATNWSTLQQSLRRDLSGRTGIPISQVNISSFTAIGGTSAPTGNNTNSTTPPPPTTGATGILVQGFITPQNEQDVQPTFTVLSDGIADNDLDLAITATSVPLIGRINPLNAVQLDSSLSQVTITNPLGSEVSPAPRSAVLAVTGLMLAGMVHLASSWL